MSEPPPIHLFNSRTRRKERFVPRDAARVSVYWCGPTVYGPAHIGNARPAVVFDVLVRLLRAFYARVEHMSNITDIDDKLIAASAASGDPVEVLARRYEAQYFEDMAGLGCARPDFVPRASAHVADMIALIEALLARKSAYEAEGHVLFASAAWPSYGALSQRSAAARRAGARIEVAPYKKSAEDFVLWKPSPPDQPGWESPWGRGRPGWHTECVAMIESRFGGGVDIHGGGADLLFPHHENEAAQFGARHDDAALARVWMHNAMLVQRGEKMSKSAGAIRSVREFLAAHGGDVLRLLLLQTHYRHPLELSDDAVRQAETSLMRLYQGLRLTQDAGTKDEGAPAPDEVRAWAASEPLRPVVAALCDDLNLPLALTHMFAAMRAADRLDAKDKAAGKAQRGALRRLMRFLGFGLVLPPHLAEIEALLRERDRARAKKDFARADKLRDKLAELGAAVEDRPGEPSLWHMQRTRKP